MILEVVLAKLLVIDNYDSFTYNLIQMFMHYNLDFKICRNDTIVFSDIINYSPDYILISPGPKNPINAGLSMDIIKSFYIDIPILGICLGMQCINEVFGGKTIASSTPMHGKTSNIYHKGENLFKGIPSPFKVARYHSLIIEPNMKSKNILIIDAWSSDGTIMSLSHKNLPVYGLQFHPESFLTTYGFALIENFLRKGSMKNNLK
jgi:anthranilate synthase component 2